MSGAPRKNVSIISARRVDAAGPVQSMISQVHPSALRPRKEFGKGAKKNRTRKRPEKRPKHIWHVLGADAPKYSRVRETRRGKCGVFESDDDTNHKRPAAAPRQNHTQALADKLKRPSSRVNCDQN